MVHLGVVASPLLSVGRHKYEFKSRETALLENRPAVSSWPELEEVKGGKPDPAFPLLPLRWRRLFRERSQAPTLKKTTMSASNTTGPFVTIAAGLCQSTSA